MKVNWTALGIVTTVALASVGGVASLTGAAQKLDKNVAVIQSDISSIKDGLLTMDKRQDASDKRVDFIYQAFFARPGKP